ncbi:MULTISPECIES: PadR family transcriptional regulator [unclassified Actinobaculum]|uniref:PadR family transcriptional regulator n=1 Tax=unclassified Actinobaculum TaxID=2609299 RepID=UPI000D5269A6|nr:MULTISPECIES: PadR family transcriptional regulator [unclassified Actinobaculum]AWE42557.1 transcriptional regulator [Actinobaculum sp. 313]RTE48778.1 PadR family transcriptional regulator [Actinobaculum sp. 352]
MSVRLALLSLLIEEPRGVYQLRQLFEERTTWNINIGQVYQTMQRLERDGLVEYADSEGRAELFRISDTGYEELQHWWDTPTTVDRSERDDLVMKVALAVTIPGINVQRLIQQQRNATLSELRDVTRLKRTDDDPTWQLVLDRRIFDLEAEARWLDHIEGAAVAAAARRAPLAAASYAEADNPTPAGRNR